MTLPPPPPQHAHTQKPKNKSPPPPQKKQTKTQQNPTKQTPKPGNNLSNKAVRDDWYFQMYYDDLPIWGFVGKIEKVIPKAGDPLYKYYMCVLSWWCLLSVFDFCL